MTTLRFNTDGGSRGNPGPSASAVYFPDRGDGIGVYIGPSSTNNEAEASALILGVEYAFANGYDAIDVRCDSQLIVNQVLGRWAIKAPTMVPLMKTIHAMLGRLAGYQIRYVPREQNKEADSIVNKVLDRVQQGEELLCQKLALTP